jgi:O-antigen ligase
VFVIVVLTGRRANARLLLSAGAGLAVVVAAAAVIAGTGPIEAKFADKDPYALRRQLLNSTVKLIDARPVTGYGLGTWRSVYPQMATFDVALLANEAHNDWAQWTCDGGIPFGLLVAGLVVWIAKPAIQSIWGLGVVGVMAHSFVDYPLREPVLSLLWFVMAGALTRVQPLSRKTDGK